MNVVNGKEVAELHQYGCHNKPRPDPNTPVMHSSGKSSWPYRNSTECVYGPMHHDERCSGCKWNGSGE